MSADPNPDAIQRNITRPLALSLKRRWIVPLLAVFFVGMGCWRIQAQIADRLIDERGVILDPKNPPRMGMEANASNELVIRASGVTLRDLIVWARLQELGVAKMSNAIEGGTPRSSRQLSERLALSIHYVRDHSRNDPGELSDSDERARAQGFAFRKYLSSLPDEELGVSLSSDLREKAIDFRSAPISIKTRSVKIPSRAKGDNAHIVAWSAPLYRELERKYGIAIEHRGGILAAHSK